MMTAIRSYAQQWTHRLRKFFLDPRVHTTTHILAYFLRGFAMSAASLGQHCQPFALSLVITGTGWPAVLTALGSCLGYLFFWDKNGLQGIAWLVAGFPAGLLLNRRPTLRSMPLLIPSIACLITAAAGLSFQIRLEDATPIAIYLLRILVAGAVTRLFSAYEEDHKQHVLWLVQGVWVLALAQILPFPWLCLGCIGAGALAVGGSFPAVALSGLALDLAQITPVPMTAITCVIYFARMIPGIKKRITIFLPGFVYLSLMLLCGKWDLYPLPPLVIGGLLGRFLGEQNEAVPRRGETGIAQVRLELTAGVFSQMQMLLLEASSSPIDEEALVLRATSRVCGSCPLRKSCKEKDMASLLTPQVLHRPLLDTQDLGFPCRKGGRMIEELHRTQEHLRILRASREIQKEHRVALLQQYQFLAEYLQDLSDTLGRRAKTAVARYKAQISLCASRQDAENGDRCQSFSGPGCSHFLLLCDGMGTGLGAIGEGSQAGSLLKKLLVAGFPGEYALRTLNSLCAIRGLAGAVTVDLAQIHLDTGKVTLYKWGAAPSYLLTQAGAEKIGTAGPPPGISVTESRETVERLSLRRGETLVLCSDGILGEDALRCWYGVADEPPGELAARILESGASSGGDDATVAVVRLVPDP